MACPVAAPIKRAGEKTPPKTPNPMQSVVNKILMSLHARDGSVERECARLRRENEELRWDLINERRQNADLRHNNGVWQYRFSRMNAGGFRPVTPPRSPR